MLKKIRRLAAMPAGERAATLSVTLLIPVISTSLSILGFQRTVDWVKRSAEPRQSDTPQRRETVIIEGVAALKRARFYTPWTGRCLAQALSLWWVLRRRGVVAELHLGVRMTDGALDAHAWVTHEGRVLADSDAVWTDFPGVFATDGVLSFTPDRESRRPQ